MNKLTPVQIKTLEAAFASYPDDFPRTSNFASFEGIQEQIDNLEDGKGIICYISKANKSEEGFHFSIEKMIIDE